MDTIPEVIKSSTIQLAPASPVWKKSLPWVFLGVLILIILIELVWGYQTFKNQPSSAFLQNNPPLLANISPQLIAQTTKTNFKTGDKVPLTIKVVTAGNPSDSTDIIVHFDPNLLEASGSGFFELGKIYKEYPVADFDNKNGTVQLSGTTPPDQTGFSGIGSLVTLNFHAKAEGSTTVSLEFVKGSTADSNIVLSGTSKDILSEVKNAAIIISNHPVAETNNQAASCPGFFQYCHTGDKAGKQFCQSGVLEDKLCSFDSKLTVSCSECQVQ